MSTTQRLLGHGKAISCCSKRMKIRTWVSWKNQTLVKKTGSVYTSPTNKQKIKEANSCRSIHGLSVGSRHCSNEKLHGQQQRVWIHFTGNRLLFSLRLDKTFTIGQRKRDGRCPPFDTRHGKKSHDTVYGQRKGIL